MHPMHVDVLSIPLFDKDVIQKKVTLLSGDLNSTRLPLALPSKGSARLFA